MTAPDPPIIVGAGPVGLAAALFLARAGITPRIIESRAEPSAQSRALAVNPRTLDILGPTGVAARMLEIGRPMRAVNFHAGTRRIARVEFSPIHPRYPFMLALSQAVTERLLEEALNAAGVEVERSTACVGCRVTDDHAELDIESRTTDPPTLSTARCPRVLGADGAHSAIRHSLNIDFPGSSMPGEWHLADAALDTTLAPDNGHAFFLDHGEFLFFIPVITDHPAPPGKPHLWRIIGNHPDFLSHMPAASLADAPTWASSFHVGHRLAANLSTARAFLAGDAAHIHSPIGARGMNLGIEDAYVFAALAAENRLAEYAHLRTPVDRAVVRRVEFLSNMAAGVSPIHRFARTTILPLMVRIPPVRRRILATVAGLDHPLPRTRATGTLSA